MHIIYLTTNIVNGKQYVGQRLTKYDSDKYFGSGKLILKAIQKYGADSFKRIIVDRADNREEANRKELFWQKFYNCFNPRGYNITVGSLAEIQYLIILRNMRLLKNMAKI